MASEINLGLFTGNQTGSLVYWDGGYATVWFGWPPNTQFGFGTCRIQYTPANEPNTAINLLKDGLAVQASAPTQTVVFIPSGYVRAVHDGVIAGAALEVRVVPLLSEGLLFNQGKPVFRNGKPFIGNDVACCCEESTLCVQGCSTPDPETISVTTDGVARSDVYEDYWRVLLGPPFTEYIECECPEYFNGITWVLQKHPIIPCRWEALYPVSPKTQCVNEIRFQALLQAINGVRQWSLSIAFGALTPLISPTELTATFKWILPPGDTCNGIFPANGYDALINSPVPDIWFPNGPCLWTNMTVALDTTG